jgi:hypothetical protein
MPVGREGPDWDRAHLRGWALALLVGLALPLVEAWPVDEEPGGWGVGALILRRAEQVVLGGYAIAILWISRTRDAAQRAGRALRALLGLAAAALAVTAFLVGGSAALVLFAVLGVLLAVASVAAGNRVLRRHPGYAPASTAAGAAGLVLCVCSVPLWLAILAHAIAVSGSPGSLLALGAVATAYAVAGASLLAHPPPGALSYRVVSVTARLLLWGGPMAAFFSVGADPAQPRVAIAARVLEVTLVGYGVLVPLSVALARRLEARADARAAETYEETFR